MGRQGVSTLTSPNTSHVPTGDVAGSVEPFYLLAVPMALCRSQGILVFFFFPIFFPIKTIFYLSVNNLPLVETRECCFV